MFVLMAFVADPALVDVAVAKLIQEFALDFFGFTFGVTRITQTHDVFGLPETSEMRTVHCISVLWGLAWVVAAFLCW